ncbi:DUF1465 family protein [uncultured Sphingomonas sp.]|uniref:DUF1465 family protein n=1 Tax=uncultured Sphingomonas sp. TaxID=158754 RepID=UPI0026083002|nr:DUF1465 family protein [uncultured Sphingomonas sp.]
MGEGHYDSAVHRRLIDGLYTEAMLLADEARSYFDEGGRVEREALPPMMRVSFSCESLKVTTRLMHVIAWLLTQRAVQQGEIAARDALDPSRRLGEAPTTESDLLRDLPEQARQMVASSIELHRRVARLDAAQLVGMPDESPARRMLDRLSLAF